LKAVYKHGKIMLLTQEYCDFHMCNIDVENIIDVQTAKRLVRELKEAILASKGKKPRQAMQKNLTGAPPQDKEVDAA